MSVRSLDEVYMLFGVLEKSQGHPNLKPIFDQAMAALVAHAEEISKDSIPLGAETEAPTAVEEAPEFEAPPTNGRRI